MAQSIQVREFIQTVCEQVKAKRAHAIITNELIAHIEDQTEAYMKSGMDENSAERRAIAQMGDPVTVGENLDQLHRPKLDWIGIVVNIVMWTISGAVMLFGLFLGVATFYSLWTTGQLVFGIIISLGFIAVSLIVAFTVISMFKFISNMLFYRGLASDYKKRKKRGEYYGKY